MEGTTVATLPEKTEVGRATNQHVNLLQELYQERPAWLHHSVAQLLQRNGLEVNPQDHKSGRGSLGSPSPHIIVIYRGHCLKSPCKIIEDPFHSMHSFSIREGIEADQSQHHQAEEQLLPTGSDNAEQPKDLLILTKTCIQETIYLLICIYKYLSCICIDCMCAMSGCVCVFCTED